MGILFQNVTTGGGAGGGAGSAISSIAVTPLNPSVVAGVRQFAAVGTFANGHTVDITGIVDWVSSSHPNMTIDSSGLATITGSAGGTSIITAAYGSATSPGSIATIVSGAVSSSVSLSNQNFGNTNAGTFILPFWLPADVEGNPIHVRMGNWDVNALLTFSSATGVDVAVYTSDGAGGVTGSPLAKFLNQTVPGTIGSFLDLTIPTATRGTDGKIVLVYTTPGAIQICGNTLYVWGRTNSVIGTATVDPLPSSTQANTNGIPYNVRVDYSTGVKRVVVGAGDSLVGGRGLATKELSAYYSIGPTYGYATDASGIVNATLVFWNTEPHWYDQQIYAGAYVFIEASINDLPATSLSAWRTNIKTKIDYVRGFLPAKVFLTTWSPSTTYGAYDSIRVQINTDIRNGTIPNVTIDGYADVDLIVRKTSDHTILADELNSGDGIHYNAAANALIAPALQALVG